MAVFNLRDFELILQEAVENLKEKVKEAENDEERFEFWNMQRKLENVLKVISKILSEVRSEMRPEEGGGAGVGEGSGLTPVSLDVANAVTPKSWQAMKVPLGTRGYPGIPGTQGWQRLLPV